MKFAEGKRALNVRQSSLLKLDDLWAKFAERNTKRYSKSIDMIKYSLYLLFDKLYWGILIK